MLRDSNQGEGIENHVNEFAQQECNAFIEALNKGGAVFKGLDFENKMAAQAKLEDFAKSLGEVKITEAELKGCAEEYRFMFTDMAIVMRDLVNGDADVDDRVDEIVEREAFLVNRINAYCNPHWVLQP